MKAASFLAVLALSALAAAAAAAQTPPPAPATSSHMATSNMPAGKMASSAGHTKETKMDHMMVKNCLAMPKAKMAADAECKDYMKNHPDWMKTKK